MSPMQKQRLIGAVVLVALGVIIVPMLFDFSREGAVEMQGIDIPPAPDAMRMEVLPLDDWSQKVDPGIDKPQPPAVVAETEAVEPTEPPVPAAVPVEEVAAEPPPSAPKEPVVVPPAPAAVKPAPVAPVPSAPAAAKKGAVTEGWILQIASLTVEAKANDLRDRLRAAGYPVFIEYGKSGGSAIYRVKAGPVAGRAAADDLKIQVKQKIGLDGLVMQYP